VRQDLWNGVEAVLDKAPSLEDLFANRTHLLAHDCWRRRGLEVPQSVARAELLCIVRDAVAREALKVLCDSYDGPVMVLKGPHTASYYPVPTTRPFADLDVLVAEPEAAHRALVAAGFEPTGFPDSYYAGLHHLRPLIFQGTVPLAVEVHRRPNWFHWSHPPPSPELFQTASAGVLGIPKALGLPAAEHALILAAHAWVELPFRRLLDLVDVAAVSREVDSGELAELSERWGMGRIWSTTDAAAAALFYRERTPASLAICARNLATARDRTVLETHLRRWLGSFWARPAHIAVFAAAKSIFDDVIPDSSETWRVQLARSRHALSNWRRPDDAYSRHLGPGGRRAPRWHLRHRDRG
jgi:hypothetical protein